MHGYNKYFIPVRPPLRSPTECRRLHRVYQLDPTLGGTATLTRLHGAAALEVLMQNVYRLGFAESLGYKPQAFQACTAAARTAEVFRFSRPLAFDTLDYNIELLEHHMQHIV
jgi:hypothetical protein